MLRIGILKAWFLAMATAILTAALWLPTARASTFNLTIDTIDQVNGYDITLIDIATNGANVATSLTGSITGLGADSYLSGTLSIVIPGSTQAESLTFFDFDGMVFPNAPYFSISSNSSGIVLADSAGYFLNVYDHPDTEGINLYFGSIARASGLFSTNLDPLNVTATPLPDTLSMAFVGLALICFLVGRKRTCAGDVSSQKPITD